MKTTQTLVLAVSVTLAVSLVIQQPLVKQAKITESKANDTSTLLVNRNNKTNVDNEADFASDHGLAPALHRRRAAAAAGTRRRAVVTPQAVAAVGAFHRRRAGISNDVSVSVGTMTQPSKFSGVSHGLGIVASPASGISTCERCMRSHAPPTYTGDNCLNPDSGSVNGCVTSGQCANEEELYSLLISSPCVCDAWKAEHIVCAPPPCFYCSFFSQVCKDELSGGASLLQQRSNIKLNYTKVTKAVKPSLLQRQGTAKKVNIQDGFEANLDMSLTGKCG